jgi:hypothetical protein
LYHSHEYDDSDDANDDDHDDDIDRILTSFKDMQTMNVEQIRERVSINCDRRI